MINQVSNFFFTATGAFAIWMTKGFKGPFDNEMVSVNERNSSKGTVRYFLGFGIWVLIGLIVFSIVK
jgi:hypothetical protein